MTDDVIRKIGHTLATMAAASGAIAMVWDKDLRLVAASRGVAEMFHVGADALEPGLSAAEVDAVITDAGDRESDLRAMMIPADKTFESLEQTIGTAGKALGGLRSSAGTPLTCHAVVNDLGLYVTQARGSDTAGLTRGYDADWLESLYDHMPDAVAVTKPDGCVIAANRAFADLASAETPLSLRGADVASLLRKVTGQEGNPVSAAGNGSSTYQSVRTRTADGVPLSLTRGDITGGCAVYTLHDLSERESLAEQSLLLKTTLESMREGVMVIDSTGRVIAINASMLQIFGIPDANIPLGSHIRTYLNAHADLRGAPKDIREAEVADRERFAMGKYLKGGTYGRVRHLRNGEVLDARRVALDDGNAVITIRLATESYRLARQTRQLERVIENVEEGVILVDRGLRVEVMNQNICDFYGVDRDSIAPGDPFRKFIELSEDLVGLSDDDREEIIADRLGYAALDTNDVVKRLRILRNGRTLQITRIPLPGEGFVATHRDVTAEIERQRLLEQARGAAEDANRLKTDFIARVTHELRTPMHGVLGIAALLEHSGLDDKQLRFLKTLQRSGRHMVDLIDGLLTISTIETGELRLGPHDCDLGLLVEDCIDMIKPQAEDKGLKLETSIALAEKSILADGTRLTQVLINLLTNAVKFTSSGTVRLNAYSRNTPKGVVLLASISDTGPGIPPEQHQMIFQKFAQIGKPSASTTEGVGLGLSITRSLVDLMGGTIRVQSQPGLGSTFTVRLMLPHSTGSKQADTGT